MITRLIRSLRDRAWWASFRLNRKAEGGGSLLCRGAIQFHFERSSQIILRGQNGFGLRLMGHGTDDRQQSLLSLSHHSRMELEEATIGRGCRFVVGRNATVSVGYGTYFNNESWVFASHSIMIGRRCAIAFKVLIMDDDGHGSGPPPYSAPIIIGDDVWIGCDSKILKGVEIGSGSIVASGAVVTRSCPPRSLLAGIPARVIRENVQWSDSQRLGAS